MVRIFKALKLSWGYSALQEDIASSLSAIFLEAPPSSSLPCSKKTYDAEDEDSAKEIVRGEFPNWEVAIILPLKFEAVGC